MTEYGQHHFEVTGLEGVHALLAFVLPRSWWLRILAVKILVFRGRLPKGSMLALLFWRRRELLASGEWTFCYAGRAWQIDSTRGAHSVFAPRFAGQ